MYVYLRGGGLPSQFYEIMTSKNAFAADAGYKRKKKDSPNLLQTVTVPFAAVLIIVCVFCNNFHFEEEGK